MAIRKRAAQGGISTWLRREWAGHAAGREAAEPVRLADIFEVTEVERAQDGDGSTTQLPSQQPPSVEGRSVHGTTSTSEVASERPGRSTAVARVDARARDGRRLHVGDSRAYHRPFCRGRFFRLTRDHSIVQELVDRGLLTPQQATHHPDANRITRALGMAPDVEAELRVQPVHHIPGDAFVLLLKDGLLATRVEDHEILGIVGSEPRGTGNPSAGWWTWPTPAGWLRQHPRVLLKCCAPAKTALGPSASVTPTIAQTGLTPAPTAVAASSPTLVGPEESGATEITAPGQCRPASHGSGPDRADSLDAASEFPPSRKPRRSHWRYSRQSWPLSPPRRSAALALCRSARTEQRPLDADAGPQHERDRYRGAVDSRQRWTTGRKRNFRAHCAAGTVAD